MKSGSGCKFEDQRVRMVTHQVGGEKEAKEIGKKTTRCSNKVCDFAVLHTSFNAESAEPS